MKKGFGLLEVIVAAVVLGFLIVGLNTLQKGNREGVLRIRARDAANLVAQRVLDSLGAMGIYSIQAKNQAACGNKSLVYCNTAYTYTFDGKNQINKSSTSGNVTQEIPYTVEVQLLTSNEQSSLEATKLTKEDNTIITANTYAKSLQATVSWTFKKTTQSIQMAKVVR